MSGQGGVRSRRYEIWHQEPVFDLGQMSAPQGVCAPAQVPIFEILKKYDGVRIHDDIKNGRRRWAVRHPMPSTATDRHSHALACSGGLCGERAAAEWLTDTPFAVISRGIKQTAAWAACRYRLTRLPKYMVLHMRRFTKNNFFVEKNPTIVNFPVKNLKLQDIVPVPRGASVPLSSFH